MAAGRVTVQKSHDTEATFKFKGMLYMPHPDTVYLDNTGDINMGSGVSIHRNVSIFTHEHDHSKGVPIAESDIIVRSIDIGDDVFIGANVVILSRVNKIGKGAVIGAGSVLTKDVGEYEVWAGNPAKFIKRRE